MRNNLLSGILDFFTLFLEHAMGPPILKVFSFDPEGFFIYEATICSGGFFLP